MGGRPTKASFRLRGGEQVALDIPPPAPTRAQPEELPLEVLYEDADLLVLNKAAGMVVHPAAGHAGGTLVNALLHRVKDLNVGGERRPGIVHRLDKDTTGCLVVAKNGPALEALQAAFKRREVEKVYLALVHGKPPDHGKIETLYARHPVHRKKFTGRVKVGKQAVTEYWTRERFPGAALMEVRLHTGRTHQIRVHLSEAGFPLWGEALYARPREPTLGRHALHAWRLSFAHPRKGKVMQFEAPLPGDLRRALDALRD